MRLRADLDHLRSSIDEYSTALDAGRDFATVSHRFHSLVATASHNPILAMLVQQLEPYSRQSTWQSLEQRQASRHAGIQRELLRQHTIIFEAIRDRDEDRAASAMSEHLTTISDGLLAAARSK
jgi:GntR family transcriptional repressor for pyruvate dehydrogenase complex